MTYRQGVSALIQRVRLGSNTNAGFHLSATEMESILDAAEQGNLDMNNDLHIAARQMLGLLTLDGDPPAVAIPREFETPEDISRFTAAYNDLSNALRANGEERKGS